MRIYEAELKLPLQAGHHDLLAYIAREVTRRLGPDLHPVRFVVSKTDAEGYHCEVGVATELSAERGDEIRPIFDFRRRAPENIDSFNVAFLVPTGIGSTIGGHAGDATPAARMIATLCDRLIIHPNVVNASDINEMPENALYVEGSIISRLLMGTVGLRPVRANRLMVIMDRVPFESFVSATVNTVSAARATYGLNCSHVVVLDPPLKLSAHYAPSGRAVGKIEAVEGFLEALHRYRGDYDAVAISTVVDVPFNYHLDYFRARGDIINPWGGAEAILTHTISCLLDVPTAHAPMTSTEEVEDLDPGIVDPRMAAEAVSYTYFQCALKGLRQSPRIVEADSTGWPAGVITASDISAIVMPDKCIGLPTLAALQQGIPVIAVRENENILENDLSALPWAPGQLHIVENYWEAAGVLAALKAGLDPLTIRRPLQDTVWKCLSMPAEQEALAAKEDAEAGPATQARRG